MAPLTFGSRLFGSLGYWKTTVWLPRLLEDDCLAVGVPEVEHEDDGEGQDEVQDGAGHHQVQGQLVVCLLQYSTRQYGTVQQERGQHP